MFEQFFMSIQQDIKLFLFFPVLCAIFRAIFIYVYKPYDLKGKWKTVWKCFCFGFWWGMDFNAYVFLLPAILVTIPGLAFSFWHVHGDTIRLSAAILYALVLYVAFASKMIFYNHFHDGLNNIVFLGRHAEKNNLLDIFFHQDHGILVLAGIIPYLLFCVYAIRGFLGLPSIPYPQFTSAVAAYGFNTVSSVVLIVGFYFFRYGGTLSHDDKPEWDTIPDAVKDDVFLSKATIDDLVAIEYLLDHPVHDVLKHTDQEDMQSFNEAMSTLGISGPLTADPLDMAEKRAKGPKIAMPSHIFLIVGESYAQNYIDPFMDVLHISDNIKQFMHAPDTAVINNFLSAGTTSRPSIVGLMTGIFDAGLEINEREAFWHGTVPTSLPVQLKKLGYTSTYWYGGSVAHGNFNHFAPACGFDHVMAATDFCGPDAPMTWVGVYDHVFLEKAAEIIEQTKENTPQFHFVYTTSNHGPYKINATKYGYDTETVMPDAPADIKNSGKIQSILGTFWYSDRAIGKFMRRMKKDFPDSMFIFTGDHGLVCGPLQSTSLMKREYTFRENHCPVFMMHHRDMMQDMFAGNHIGGHMNIMPTIMELIAPAGFTYYSLVPSLTEPIRHVITPYHWLTDTAIGGYDTQYYQALTAVSGTETKLGEPPYVAVCEAEKNLTAYLLRHPELLKQADKFA